jgi:undecaprenyl-diphosphatase
VDLILLFKALLMGVVEGLTEFLPVSSTGHLIIAGELLDFMDKEKGDVFEIVIQSGAMLAVCWIYFERFSRIALTLHTRESQRFVGNLLVALVPAVVLGLLLGAYIKEYLFHPVPVACALVVGGFLILWAEKRDHQITIHSVEAMTWKDALKIGFAQCLALFPGTSRSGATIIGGLLFGCSRKTAAEFSFFLAVPTLLGATAYDLYHHHHLLSAEDVDLFIAGTLAAFISAMVAIRGLLYYIQRHDFTVFAWYRIVFGAFILITAQFGWISWGG